MPGSYKVSRTVVYEDASIIAEKVVVQEVSVQLGDVDVVIGFFSGDEDPNPPRDGWLNLITHAFRCYTTAEMKACKMNSSGWKWEESIQKARCLAEDGALYLYPQHIMFRGCDHPINPLLALDRAPQQAESSL
jgi:hypothetical protein